MVYKSTDDYWFAVPQNYYHVLLKEKAARKFRRMLKRQNREIKEFIISNKDSILPMNRTVTCIDGKPAEIYYACKSDSLEKNIKILDTPHLIRVKNGVFISDLEHMDASREVKSFYKKLHCNE